jgi:hypothetical protein
MTKRKLSTPALPATDKRSKKSSALSPDPPFNLSRQRIAAIKANAGEFDRGALETLEDDAEGWKAETRETFEAIYGDLIDILPDDLATSLRAYSASDAKWPTKVTEYVNACYLQVERRTAQRKAAADAAAATARANLARLTSAKTVVAFLDVGQGDCTLVRTKSGQIILIDCGHQPSQRNQDKPNTANLCSVLNSQFFTNAVELVLPKHKRLPK